MHHSDFILFCLHYFYRMKMKKTFDEVKGGDIKELLIGKREGFSKMSASEKRKFVMFLGNVMLRLIKAGCYPNHPEWTKGRLCKWISDYYKN